MTAFPRFFTFSGRLFRKCQVLRRLGENSLPPYRFDAENDKKVIQIYQDEDGKLTDEPKDSVYRKNKKEDYGIILRIANPFVSRREMKVLILAGNHGFGTESAIKFVSGPECIKLLPDTVKESDLAILFHTNIFGKETEELSIMRLSKWDGKTWDSIPGESRRIEWQK